MTTMEQSPALAKPGVNDGEFPIPLISAIKNRVAEP
jgi:hypothetical protein